MSIANIFKKLNSRDTRILPSINTLTKIIFIALIAITATFFVKNILAATNTNIIKQTQDAQTKSNNAESWQLNSWNTNTVNLLTTLTGPLPFKNDGSLDTTQFQVSGLFGSANSAIASLYHPQASGIQYVAQVKDNFLGKSTYAQGVAFNKTNSLQALLPIWKSLRNVIYALSSLIFIIIGIMIMLRVKISPQAVITIQNSIPKLVTSLILVTFSYAIAGLVIDISYWLQSFVLSILFSAKGVDLGSNLFNGKWTSLNFGDLFAGQTPFNFKSLANTDFVQLSVLANATVPALSLILLGGVVGQVIIGSIIGGLGGLFGTAAGAGGNIGGGALGWVVGAAGGIIFMIILFILVAIWLIKLFFGLLTAYVTIIIEIITAPIMIGIGAFPNSKIGFSSWLIGLISKVAVFPVVLIALVFINYLIEIAGGGTLWTPNLLNTGVSSLISGGDGGSIIGAAIGLAGLAMLSKLPTLVPEAIFMLKPSPFGKAIGENMQKNVLTGAFGTVKKGVEEGVTDYGGRRVSGKLEKFKANRDNRNAKKTNDEVGENMSDGSGI